MIFYDTTGDALIASFGILILFSLHDLQIRVSVRPDSDQYKAIQEV